MRCTRDSYFFCRFATECTSIFVQFDEPFDRFLNMYRKRDGVVPFSDMISPGFCLESVQYLGVRRLRSQIFWEMK